MAPLHQGLSTLPTPNQSATHPGQWDHHPYSHWNQKPRVIVTRSFMHLLKHLLSSAYKPRSPPCSGIQPCSF